MRKLLFAILLAAVLLIYITNFNKEAFLSIITTVTILTVVFTGSRFIENFIRNQK